MDLLRAEGPLSSGFCGGQEGEGLLLQTQSWLSQTSPSFAPQTSGLFLLQGERGRSALRLSCFRGTAVLAKVHSIGLPWEVGKQWTLVERPLSRSPRCL